MDIINSHYASYVIIKYVRVDNLKALILSGGTGSRLRPLTHTNAKQLLPLANKPILFHVIEKLVKAGIYEIGIVVGDTHRDIKDSVGNGAKWNVSIKYIHQTLPLGLAHAVKTASDFIGDDDFLMILGDNIFSMNLDSLIENFYGNKANTSILLHKVENPSQFGVAVVDNGQIIKLVEKPEEFVSDLIVTGVYVFDNSIFKSIDNIEPSERGELEITDAIANQISNGGKVTYEMISGWWKDTGTLHDILEANALILDTMKNENKPIKTDGSVCTGKLWVGENTVIKNSRIVGPVVIAANSVVINSYIGPYTCIGKSATIKDCELDNCIVLENTRLESLDKKISESLIGKNVVIKASENRRFSNTFLVGDNSKIYL